MLIVSFIVLFGLMFYWMFIQVKVWVMGGIDDVCFKKGLDKVKVVSLYVKGFI